MDLKELINKKKNVCVIGIVLGLLFAIAETIFFVLRNNSQDRDEQSGEKKKEEN